MNARPDSFSFERWFKIAKAMRHLARRSTMPGMIALLTAVGFAACGGGGGGGGSTQEIQIIREEAFLLKDTGPEPRTGQVLQLRLTGLEDIDEPLTEEDVVVLRNGAVDVEARVAINPPNIEKFGVTLILDVSSSLSPADFQSLKESAKEFADDIETLASTLRIFYFSSVSQTKMLGEYVALAAGGSTNWSPDPNPDIDSIPGGTNSTALYHAVNVALAAEGARDDLVGIFSDGKENSSPEGAREAALALIDDDLDPVRVFSVGFGAVDPTELRELSARGRFLGVRSSIDGILNEVARSIRSFYTIVYDSPVAFGPQTLGYRIRVGRKTLRHESMLDAGIDLARSVFARYPVVPGSIVELTDLSNPMSDPSPTQTFEVATVDKAVQGADSLFAFAIELTNQCIGDLCPTVYQGPYGEGAQSETGGIYLPPMLTAGVQWEEPSGDVLEFIALEDVRFFRGTSNSRVIECARVTYGTAERDEDDEFVRDEDGIIVIETAKGTHWFAREIGLVRSTNDDGDIVRELTAPPCLSSSFAGDCTVE
jgi:hypothetical protein